MGSKETPSSLRQDDAPDRSRAEPSSNDARRASEAGPYNIETSEHLVRDSYRTDDDTAGYSDFGTVRRTAPEDQRYQYELEMMKAREQDESAYREHGSSVPSGSRHVGPGDEYTGLRRSESEIRGAFTPTERPSLDGFSRVENGKRYRLVVVQHPSRARMCGFGDKDRRPLSPTLIVKLIITDEETGAEINPLDVNTSLSLLATDLCHPDDLSLASRNILVHHQASALPQLNTMAHGQSTSRTGDISYRSSPAFTGGLPEASAELDTHQHNGGPLSPHDGRGPPTSSDPYGRSQFSGPLASGAQVGAESYTRNLVGAAVASASVLKDEDDKWCIFFVFQDISVRTEGVYRIKLMFVNLEVNGRVGTGVAEALAEVYTEPFTVYSPRRFPGMLDPTPLSRKLASQGIKIPVRNDKKKQRKQNDDDAGGGDDDGGSGVDDEDE